MPELHDLLKGAAARIDVHPPGADAAVASARSRRRRRTAVVGLAAVAVLGVGLAVVPSVDGTESSPEVVVPGVVTTLAPLSPREDVANIYEARLEPDGQTLVLTYIEGCGPGLRWDVADNAGEVLARPVVLPPPVGTGCADIAITAESRTRLPTPAGERPVRVVGPGGQVVVPLDGRQLYAPQVPDGFDRELSYPPNPGGWTADTWRSRCGSFTLLQGPRALVTVEEDSGWEDAGTRDVNGFRATLHRYTSVSSLLGTTALSWTTPEGQVVLGGAGECLSDDELLAIALSLRLPED